MHEQNQKCDQLDVIPRIKVPSVVIHSKCPSWDLIGDTENTRIVTMTNIH